MVNRNSEKLFKKCPGCGYSVYKNELKENFWVCPKCEHYFRLSAKLRMEMLLDEGSFSETDSGVLPADPLKFSDKLPYAERIQKYREKTRLNEAISTGRAKIGGHKIIICALDFSFMGGSMGSVVGEKIARAFERALKEKLPVIMISSSGGARMQEGILSLMQMAKTAAAVARLSNEGIPYLSILSDPTSGGVSASFALIGDINISEPNALIAFAGPRVIKETINEDLPPGFQRSEFLLKHGMLDMVVEREELRPTLIRLLILFSKSRAFNA